MIDNTKVQTAESQAKITPEMAIELLKKGNDRFVKQELLERDILDQVKTTGSGQSPFAVVLGCIDSRVPAELVFDQAIGDIFNTRIAGNFINEDILGSLEFACKVAGSKVIVVLGHSSCGAVKGAINDVQLGNLTGMLAKLKPAVNAITDETEDRSTANAGFVQKVVDKNIELSVQNILNGSDVLKEMYDNNEIDIVGAMYDVNTGIAHF